MERQESGKFEEFTEEVGIVLNFPVYLCELDRKINLNNRPNYLKKSIYYVTLHRRPRNQTQ